MADVPEDYDEPFEDDQDEPEAQTNDATGGPTAAEEPAAAAELAADASPTGDALRAPAEPEASAEAGAAEPESETEDAAASSQEAEGTAEADSGEGAVQGGSGDSGQSAAPEQAQSTRTEEDRVALTELFDRIDVNKNGALERDELQRVFGEFSDQFLHFCDKDKDIKIDRQEWLDGILRDTATMSVEDFQRDWIERMQHCVGHADQLGYGWYAGSSTQGAAKENTDAPEATAPPAEPPAAEQSGAEEMTQQDKEAYEVIQVGIYDMLMSRPLHSIKSRVIQMDMDPDAPPMHGIGKSAKRRH